MRYVDFGLGLLAGALALSSQASNARDLDVTAHGQEISVSALSDNIVRIRIWPKGQEPRDESWAVARKIRDGRAEAQVDGDILSTDRMKVVVDPATLAVRVLDPNGKVIVSDVAPLERKGTSFAIDKDLGLGEHIFGMGDKTGGVDRRGKSFTNWNTDSYGFDNATDPIYKSIPFYVSVGGKGGAYGLLLDNTYRSWFDFGHRTADRIEIGAVDGPVDYYVIAGPTMRDVVRGYTHLTGKAPMPPRWMLGYQQSRWSYMSEKEVRDLAARLRKDRVPTDVIWLDIDFQDRNRPFTINHKTFPHFKQMVGDLDAMGIKTVAIADLHIAHAPDQGYAPFDQGIAQDRFVKNADGSLYVAPVWPGPSVFPEFTQASTRAWWGTLFKGLVDDGIAGIWNDMNEPAIFDTPTKTMPLDVQDRISGPEHITRTTDQREIHNVFGMENSRATYEGLLKLRPNERPFVMTRASYAGGQRYAATWTGDNSSTWEHLKLSVSQTLNLGLSGFSWAGADVGGFTGGPSPELLTRWFEYATFAPIFRDHSQKDAPRAEPWVDGPEQLAIRRRYVDARYRLMPYLYAVAANTAETGDPFMRPIAYDYPGVLDSGCNMSMQFTVGGALLVAGNPKPESPRSYAACLPKGGWYDYWTGEKVTGKLSEDGSVAQLEIAPKLDALPVFVRAGTILPRQSLVQSTSEVPQGPLELNVYPGPDCHGTLYDDDGHSLDFERGGYARQQVSCTMAGDHLTSLTISAREGKYVPWWKQLRIVIHGAEGYTASIAGKPIAMTKSNGGSSFTIPASAGATKVSFALAR
ncbi:MAG: TIM-barrel domain-containing protein [Sphingomonadaceae bacterium]